MVIEKRKNIGGNIYTENVKGINVHKYGAHIFHTSNKEVWDYINQFAEFNRYTNSPVANYKNELYNLPFNMNTFNRLWGVITPAEAQAKIEEERKQAGIVEPKNLEEQAISLVGTTIYEKLKADLGNPDNPKYVFKGLGCFNDPPKVIADDDYANKNISLFDSEVNIYVYNIGKFDKDNTKMKAFNEFLGKSFYDKLAEMRDLVIIMDESHHYRADKGMAALNELDPILGLELTATPIATIKNKQVHFKNVVYEYPLSEAIKDGYTRVPFAVTRTDIDFYHFGDEQLDKLMLNDGVKCHEMIKNKLAFYSKNNNKALVKPFMLVVCKDTDHAKKIEEYIKSNEFRNGKYKNKTIKIESKMTGIETEANTKLLLDVERTDNPVEIVIHVNMLKEGWDVNNLYTIVPLRTASSKILREQMVGRGLRLPYGERIGDKEIDAVMLTAHDKFHEILEEAQKGNSIFKLGNVIKVEDVEDEKITYTQIALDLTEEQDELSAQLELKEDDEKYNFSSNINNLLKEKVSDYVYNNEKEITEKDKNKI